jgi:hypothetical protein
MRVRFTMFEEVFSLSVIVSAGMAALFDEHEITQPDAVAGITYSDHRSVTR